MPVEGVTDIGGRAVLEGSREALWMFEAPRVLTVRERLNLNRSAKRLATEAKDDVAFAKGLFGLVEDDMRFSVLIEEAKGVFWAATEPTMLVIAREGVCRAEGGGLVVCDEPPLAVVTLFGDMERYVPELMERWARSGGGSREERELLEAFPANLCLMSGKLKKEGLRGGAFMWMRAGRRPKMAAAA